MSVRILNENQYKRVKDIYSIILSSHLIQHYFNQEKKVIQIKQKQKRLSNLIKYRNKYRRKFLNMKNKNSNNQMQVRNENNHPLLDKTEKMKNQSNQESRIKKNLESSQNITSISTFNKIGYDHSIDEFSRQFLPSENDISKSAQKYNMNKHLKPFPELQPFKSQAERNPLVQPRKHSYSVINNNCKICIDKLEFKINQPNKEKIKAQQTFYNREQVVTHSSSDKMQINKMERTNYKQIENNQQNNDRRQTTQEIFQSNIQRITNSESPKKSSRYIKIFQNQVNRKDSSISLNNYQTLQFNNSQYFNNNRQSIDNFNSRNSVNIINKRQLSNEIDYKKNTEYKDLTRIQQMHENNDNSNLQNIALKVIEIAKNQQDYLQNISMQNISPIQPQYNFSPPIVYQLHQNSQQPNQQQFSQQQYFDSNPNRNSLKNKFVQQQSNLQPTIQQIQYVQQNQLPFLINTSLTPQNYPHRNLQSIQSQSLEFPSRFCSQGGNPYSQSYKRIFTEGQSRETSPKLIERANSIKLAQNDGQIGMIGGIQFQNKQQYEQFYPKNVNNSYIDINQHLQNIKKINQQNSECYQINNQKKDLRKNSIEVDQKQLSQGQMVYLKDEIKNQEVSSTQNSINNQIKFASFGIGSGIGGRFSFNKSGSQMEINNQQLQDNHSQKNKSLEYKSDYQKENKLFEENSIKTNLNKTQDINLIQYNESKDINSLSPAENFIKGEQKLKKVDNSSFIKKTNISDNNDITQNQQKMSAEGCSQRKSYSSLGRNSLYSPIRNYFKQNTQEKMRHQETSDEDKLGITPVSMMHQQKRSLTVATPEDFQRIMAQKEKNDREVTADPIEIYPSQCDHRLQSFSGYYTNTSQDNLKEPSRNTIHTYGNTQNSKDIIFTYQGDLNEKRKHSFYNQQINPQYLVQNDQQTQESRTQKQNENQEAEGSRSNQKNKNYVNYSNSSSKKFPLEKLKSIITSDLKTAQYSQYIDEYTLNKNKELLEKHKMKLQRNNSTSINNTSAEMSNPNITNSVDKNSVIIRNIDNRSSFSASRINTSFTNGQEICKVANNQSIFPNQFYTSSQSTTPNHLLQSYIPNYYPIKEQNDFSASSINPFTESSFQSTPLNKLQDTYIDNSNNHGERKNLVQESFPSTGTITKIINVKNQQQKLPQNIMPTYIHKIDEINTENTHTFKIINDKQMNQQFEKNMLISTQPIPKQSNDEVDSKRTYLLSDCEAPPAQLLQMCNAYELKYPNQYIDKQNKKGSMNNIHSQLFPQAQPNLQSYNQEINYQIQDQQFREINLDCSEAQQHYQKTLNPQQVEQQMQKETNNRYGEQQILSQAQPDSNLFNRKKSLTELSRNCNKKNPLNQSIDFKKKQMFLPPKPFQNNLSLSNNHQNQSFDDLKKQISCTQSAKNSRNSIFKNPKSIKDSIIKGSNSFSSPSEEIKINDLFNHTTNSTNLNFSAKLNMLSKLSNNEIVCHNLNGGERLNTFEDVSQIENINTHALSSTNQQISENQNSQSVMYYSGNQQSNQQYSTDKKYQCSTYNDQNQELNKRTPQILTQIPIQQLEKENVCDKQSNTSNFPLFSEFFSSIQKEYQKSIIESNNEKQIQNQTNYVEQNSAHFSIKNDSYQNTGCFREDTDVSSKQNLNQIQQNNENQYIMAYNQINDTMTSSQEHSSKQIENQFNGTDDKQVKQISSCLASIRQNTRSFIGKCSNLGSESSIFNKSNSTIPQNEQTQQYPSQQEFQQTNSFNILKESIQNNVLKNSDCINQQKYKNQDMKKIKQKLFQNGSNQQNQRKLKENFNLNDEKCQISNNNSSFNGNNSSSNIYSQKRSHQQGMNNCLNNNSYQSRNIGQQIYNEQNNNNSSIQLKELKLQELNFKNISSSSNNRSNSNVFLQYPSTSKSNVTNQQSKVLSNTQSFITQSNVPTQQSLQNISNISKFSDCTNSKLIQIFQANQQLDQLTGNTSYSPNILKGLSKQVKSNESNNIQTTKQRLSQNSNNQSNSMQYQQQTQQLQQKLIECNQNLETVKIQSYQKLHGGEQFQESRLCLYVNFFIESLNLVIINNQNYKELKNSLNDLTAILEKIAVSADNHSEQFLSIAHKGYEIGLQKLGIIKKLN